MMIGAFRASSRQAFAAAGRQFGEQAGLLSAADLGHFAKVEGGLFDEEYFQHGTKSCYSNYRPMPELNRQRAAAIIQSLQPPHGSEIIDVGCAYGFLVAALRDLGFDRAVGWEVSSHAIAKALEFARPGDTESRSVERLEEALRDRWASGQLRSANLVIMKDVLEHIPLEILPRFIGSMASVGQRLLVIVPVAKETEGAFVNPDDEADVTHVTRLTRAGWMELLHRSICQAHPTVRPSLRLEPVLCEALKGAVKAEGTLAVSVHLTDSIAFDNNNSSSKNNENDSSKKMMTKVALFGTSMVRAEPIKTDALFGSKIQKKFLQPPLGIYRMQAFLSRVFASAVDAGRLRIDVFDPALEQMLHGGSLEHLYERVTQEGYDILGFSPIRILLGEDYWFMSNIHRAAQQSPNPRPISLAGGNEASMNSATLLQVLPWLDFCASGLGEPVFQQLIKSLIWSPPDIRLPTSADLQWVPGLIHRKASSHIVVVEHESSTTRAPSNAFESNPVAKIDGCTFREISAYWGDNIPYERYWDFNASLGPVDPNFSGTTIKTVRLFTRSFCPYRCSFCSHQTFGRKVYENAQSLTKEQIGDLIQQAVRERGAEGIYFNDDEFLGTPKNAERILEHIRSMQSSGAIPRSVRFFAQTRVDKVSPNIIQLMKDVGFTFLSFGVESFDDASLKAVDLRKDFTAAQAVDSVRMAIDLGMPITNVNLILLHPSASKAGLIRTVETSCQLLRESLLADVRLSLNCFPLIDAYSGAPINDIAQREQWPTLESSLTTIEGTDWPYVMSYLPIDPQMRRLVLDDRQPGFEPVRDAWLTRYNELMEQFTSQQAWPSLPVSRSIGVNGLVTFMSMYELLAVDGSESTETIESMTELLWRLVEKFNPDVESTANSLHAASANVLLYFDRAEQRPRLRCGNMEVEIPRPVAEQLWVNSASDRQPLLFSTAGASPDRIKRAIDLVVRGKMSLVDALSEEGIACHTSEHLTRVLLIAPYSNYDGSPLKTAVPHPGLERIAYHLRRQPGVDVLVFNPNLTGRAGLDSLAALAGRVDVVGFNFIPVTLANDAQFIDWAATRFPNALLIGGGLNIDRLPFDEIFDAAPFDAFIAGPGEARMAELIAALPPTWRTQGKQLAINSLNGLFPRVYLRGHVPEKRPRSSTCQEKNVFADDDEQDNSIEGVSDAQLRAGIAYDRADLVHGKTYNTQLDQIHGGMTPFDMIGRRRLYVKVSDRCRARCIFCSAPFVKNTPASLDFVIEQIKAGAGHYDSVHFADNDLLFDADLTLRLCKRVVDAGLQHVPKVCKARTDEVDDSLLSALKTAGFNMITFGVESFDDGILKRMWKMNTAANNRRAIEATLRAGIRPGMDMIFFSPWETQDTLLSSLRAALSYVQQGAYLNLVPEIHVHPGDHIHKSPFCYPIEYQPIEFASTGRVLLHPKRAKVARQVAAGSTFEEDTAMEELRRQVLTNQRESIEAQTTRGLLCRNDLATAGLSWQGCVDRGWLKPFADHWALLEQPLALQQLGTQGIDARRYVSFSLSSLYFSRAVFEACGHAQDLQHTNRLIEQLLDSESTSNRQE